MSRDAFSFRTPAITHTLTKISYPEFRKLLFSFANRLRKNLDAKGLDRDLSLEAIRQTIEEFGQECHAINEECMHLVEEALENFLNSQEQGGDILGRILFYFLFESAPGGRLVYEDSHADNERACMEFVQGVIPRPLMRLFLVSVRGSVEGIDPFQALPVLFGAGGEYIQEKTEEALELAKDYRMGEESEDSPIYYAGFFLDMRVRVFALELLEKVWERMEQMPGDRLLQVYENLQSKRRKATGVTDMERMLTVEDMEQLCGAVRNGLDALRKALRCEMQRGQTAG